MTPTLGRIRTWEPALAPPEELRDLAYPLTQGGRLALAGSRATILQGGIDEKAMSVPAIITTPAVDRTKDVLVPEGCRYDGFALSPGVFFGHQLIPGLQLPIGQARANPDAPLALAVTPGKDVTSRCWFAQRGKFAADAMGVFELCLEGALNGVSIGFNPDEPQHETVELLEGGGRKFHRWELLEWSIVGIACNQTAAIVRKWLSRTEARGDRHVSPALLKSLEPLAEARREWVTGGLKAEQFDEDKHPRADDGKFGSGGGGGEKKPDGEPAPKQGGEKAPPRDEWQGRQDRRDAARNALESARGGISEGTYEASQALTAALSTTRSPKDAVAAIDAYRAAESSAMEKVSAALPPDAAKRLAEERADLAVKTDKKASAYCAALEKLEAAQAKYDEISAAEPEEPPEPTYPDAPAEDAPDADHDRYEAAVEKIDEKYQAAYDRWSEKHDKWQEKNDAAEEKVASAEEKASEREEEFTDAIASADGELNDLADTLIDDEVSLIDRADEEDAEPEEAGEEEDDAEEKLTLPRRLKGGWSEGDHPRSDDGKFGSGGGGGGGKKPDSRPAGGGASTAGKPSRARRAASAVASAGKRIAAAGLGVPKEKLNALAAHVPAGVRAPVGNTWHAVHGVLMAGNNACKALANEVAKGKGLDEGQVKQLGKTLGAIDLTFQGAMMAAAAGATATANPALAVAAKAASYCPVASVAYIVGSSATPKGVMNTIKAAYTLLREKFPEQMKGAAQFAWGAIRHPLTSHSGGHKWWIGKAYDAHEDAEILADGYAAAANKDQWLALFSVAFDDVKDVAKAVEMADEASAESSEGKGMVSPRLRAIRIKRLGLAVRKAQRISGQIAKAFEEEEKAPGAAEHEAPLDEGAEKPEEKEAQAEGDEPEKPDLAKLIAQLTEAISAIHNLTAKVEEDADVKEEDVKDEEVDEAIEDDEERPGGTDDLARYRSIAAKVAKGVQTLTSLTRKKSMTCSADHLACIKEAGEHMGEMGDMDEGEPMSKMCKAACMHHANQLGMVHKAMAEAKPPEDEPAEPHDVPDAPDPAAVEDEGEQQKAMEEAIRKGISDAFGGVRESIFSLTGKRTG